MKYREIDGRKYRVTRLPRDREAVRKAMAESDRIMRGGYRPKDLLGTDVRRRSGTGKASGLSATHAGATPRRSRVRRVSEMVQDLKRVVDIKAAPAAGR